MSTPENPFASPPEIDDDAVVEMVGDAEDIRLQYLTHEAAVRSIGFLYYLGGVLSVLVMFGHIAAGFVVVDDVAGLVLFVVFIIFDGVWAALIFAVGRGLRILARWVRIPVGILSTLGLPLIPIGTAISAYILYLIFCRKGRIVFSPEYREVIRQTPHIKCKTSCIFIAAVILFVALLFVVLLFAMFWFWLFARIYG